MKLHNIITTIKKAKEDLEKTMLKLQLVIAKQKIT